MAALLAAASALPAAIVGWAGDSPAILLSAIALGEPLADAGAMLLGLNRRQCEVQAAQSEALLEQTRLAQAGRARAAALANAPGSPASSTTSWRIPLAHWACSSNSPRHC